MLSHSKLNYLQARRCIHVVAFLLMAWSATTTTVVFALVPPFLDGGKSMPKLYDSWLNGNLANQARSAVDRAISAGKTKIEVQFPPVPNVEEVRFGTPLNKKFGTKVVAKDLGVPGGYRPGSEVSRQLIAFSNMYWAKQIAPGVAGGIFGAGGKAVSVLSAEPVSFGEIKRSGVNKIGPLGGRNTQTQTTPSPDGGGGALILANPGGEDTWDRLYARYASSQGPVVVLNNAYSTTYDLGNNRGYEEAYYLKRISKGWVFRSYPGPWQAFLEKPDGTVELLKSYKTKPKLNEVAPLVREESFRRYAINNDRWSAGFGERL